MNNEKQGLDLVFDRIEASRVRVDTLLAGRHGALATNVESMLEHINRLNREALAELVILRQQAKDDAEVDAIIRAEDGLPPPRGRRR